MDAAQGVEMTTPSLETEAVVSGHLLSDTQEDILRVGASSSPQKVASAISHAVHNSQEPVLRAIGAGAVNQAIKAVAIARGYVAVKGGNMSCIPGFDTVTMKDGSDVSAITLKILVK